MAQNQIMMTIEEFGQMQNQLLELKHQNNQLNQKLNTPKQENVFQKDLILECIESINADAIKNQQKKALINQVLEVVEEMWPKEIANNSVSEEIQKQAAFISSLKRQLIKKEELSSNMQAQYENKLQEKDDYIQKLNQEIQKLKSNKESQPLEQENANLRSQLQDKYQLQCELQQMQSELYELQKVNKEIQQKSDQTEKINELQQQLQLASLEYENLKTNLKNTMTENYLLKEKYQKSIQQVQELTKQKEQSEQLSNDLQTEKKIMLKRQQTDSKDLKAEVQILQTKLEQLKQSNYLLESELKQRKEDKERDVRLGQPKADAQEKRILEQMSYRIQELEDILFNYQQEKSDIQELKQSNEMLKEENWRLSQDLAMLGSQINQLVRSGDIKGLIGGSQQMQ